MLLGQILVLKYFYVRVYSTLHNQQLTEKAYGYLTIIYIQFLIEGVFCTQLCACRHRIF